MNKLLDIWNLIHENEVVTTIFRIIIILISTIIVNKIFKRVYKKSKIEKNTHIKFLRSIITALIWILGIVSMMSQIPGVSTFTKTLLAGSGVVAAILGLAAKETFGNIISGLVIAGTKPFEVGDRIVLHDGSKEITGFVENITLRHTTLRTYKNTEFFITNSKLDTYIIENTTRNSNKLGLVEPINVWISYNSNLDVAVSIMEKIVGNHKDFLDIRTEKEKADGVKKVTVLVKELGDNGILLRASMRTKGINESFGACSDCLRDIKKEFDKNNIVIPFNTLTISNLPTVENNIGIKEEKSLNVTNEKNITKSNRKRGGK